MFVLLINAAKFRELNPNEWSSHGRGTVSEENRFRLPLNSINRQFESIKLFNPSIKHFDLKERTIPVSHTYTFRLLRIYARMYSLRRYLRLLILLSHYFRFIYLTKLLAPFTDWTYDRIYYATCFSIRPLSAISSQFTLDLVIGNEKSDRVSFFSFSLTPSPRIVHRRKSARTSAV